MRFLIVLLLLLGTALPARAAQAESAYDRVMRTGVLRCGYAMWPRWVERDPNTGAMSGVWVDFVEAVAQNMHLKVDWTAEVNPGDFATALNTGKIDAFCLAAAATGSRLAQAYFSTPAVYAAFDVYVRADDTRFDSGLAALDDPSVRISGVEGDETGIVVRRRFPHATLVEVSGAEGGAGMMMNLKTGKADAAITDIMTVRAFNDSHGAALKRIGGLQPLVVFGASMVLPLGEATFLQVVDSTIRDLLNLGVVEQLMAKHGFRPGDDYMPVALPYAVPAGN